MPEEFVNWVKICLTTSRFFVIINGKPCGCFLGKRGLRQGDPICPYLFVLCIEVLTRKLKELETNPEFKYHAKCKSMKLTHITFADVVTMFCHGNSQSPKLLMQKFEEFPNMSGLQINNPKSQIFYANMDVEVKDHLLQSLNFKEGTLPVKYLGLPLISTKLSIADCMPLIEKVKQKLNSWTSKMLSDSGRVQLVKSVAL